MKEGIHCRDADWVQPVRGGRGSVFLLLQVQNELLGQSFPHYPLNISEQIYVMFSNMIKTSSI